MMRISYFLFYLLCFFIAYSCALRIQAGAGVVSLPYAISLAGLALLLFKKWFEGRSRDCQLPRAVLAVFAFVILYTALCLAGIVRTQFAAKVYSQDAVFRVIEQACRLILSGCIAVYVVSVVRNRALCLSGLVVLAISAGLVALYGIYQVLGTYGGFYRSLLPGTASYGMPPGVEGATRAVGTMHEPSFLAGFLCFSIIMTLILLASKEQGHRFISRALFLSLLVQGMCLVMTASSGGFAGFITSLVVGGVLLRGYTRRRYITYWVVMAVLLVAPVAYVAVQSRLARELMVATVGKPTHISTVERTAFVIAALQMFADHPLIGVGPALYNDHVREYTTAFSLRRILIPNNVYAELLSETGILGFVTFVVLLTTIFRCALRKWRESHNTDAIAGGLLISIASLLVQFMAYPTFKMEFIWLLFGIALAPWKPKILEGELVVS